MSDDAIRKAAGAAILPQMCEWHGMKPYANCDTCSMLTALWDRDARAVLDAVRPLIEADLRERLAAAIEFAAKCYDEPGATIGEEQYAQGLIDAARIVRERP